jgi:hypothetical protein
MMPNNNGYSEPHRFDHIQRIVEALIESQERLVHSQQQLVSAQIFIADAQRKTEEHVAQVVDLLASLAESEKGTDERVNLLIGKVDEWIRGTPRKAAARSSSR